MVEHGVGETRPIGEVSLVAFGSARFSSSVIGCGHERSWNPGVVRMCSIDDVQAA
jgi:hypothetical protein